MAAQFYEYLQYVVMICLIKMLFFLLDHKHLCIQTPDQNQDNHNAKSTH